MKRLLIVNADDCNLTPGVTEAILDCHDQGILTSTTFMANLPVDPQTVRELKARKDLGVGIHLNVTFGYPVSRALSVRSLLGSEGQFKKYAAQKAVLPKPEELFREYQNQIYHFRRLFGFLPTHLDTHHQMHDDAFFLNALMLTAKHFSLPLRKSCLPMPVPGLRTTDYFFGNLTVQGYWRKISLDNILRHIPDGISEIMCHPGKNDKDLQSVSSFTAGREVEWSLFRDRKFRKILADCGVTLGNFKTLARV